MITGKERIANSFKALSEKGEKGLITYLTAGFPSPDHTLEVARELALHSDMIEIGIPFSDPVADGPVIQNSSYHALERGIRLSNIFNLAGKIREGTDIPLIFMTYYNPVMRYGIENFVKSSHESGVDGLIVPDLPVEEDHPLRECAQKYGLSLIPLVAPTSTDERISKISGRTDSFIYCVSVTGVTGAGKEIGDLKTFSCRVRKNTSHPLAVGFGITGPGVARRLAPYFDAVVVGSAIVKEMDSGEGLPVIVDRVGRLAGEIKATLRNGCDTGE
ncbi:MAG TPA: tryptophan synthase subunit alpha [Desulfotomaculum sp.]|nr:tryptophan synthase subunit alpha [Desulfotomaculum sp.]